jgi:ribosomal protein S12 methylthiotransferase accessory factor YcaO
MASMSDDSARLMAIIEGVEGYSAPVGLLWKKYEAWLTNPNTVTVKFEDLIGEQGGGSSERQLAVLRRLTKHLDIDINESELLKVANQVFSSESPTFRKGVAGGWRKHLNKFHIEAIKKQTGDLLVRLGYEESESWS